MDGNESEVGLARTTRCFPTRYRSCNFSSRRFVPRTRGMPCATSVSAHPRSSNVSEDEPCKETERETALAVDCIDYVVGWDEIVWSRMNVGMSQKNLKLTNDSETLGERVGGKYASSIDEQSHFQFLVHKHQRCQRAWTSADPSLQLGGARGSPLVTRREANRNVHLMLGELGEIIDGDITFVDVVVNERNAFCRAIPSQGRNTCKTEASRVEPELCFRNTRSRI